MMKTGVTMRITWLVLPLLFQVACKSNDSSNNSAMGYADPVYNGQQLALNHLEEAADNSEGNMQSEAPMRLRRMVPRSLAPHIACSQVPPFSACTNGTTSYDFEDCMLTDGSNDVIQFDGGAAASFIVTATGVADNTGCTSVTQNSAAMPTGDTLNLVYDIAVIFQSVASVPDFDGLQITLDFNPGTAWDTTTFPNASQGESAVSSANSRVLTINGAHDGVLAPNGSVMLDFVTQGQVTVTGTWATANRVIQNGATITSWDNVKKYKVVHTTGPDSNGNPVTWTDPTCCTPTEGQLTSVYSGSITGTATLTFSTSCGTAIFVDTDGGSIPVNLEC
jgi:hypothetical protein